MASQQQRRDNTTHERELRVEKDIVPKRATKFEELAKATDAAATAAAGKGGSAVAMGVQHNTGRQQGEGGLKSKTDIETVAVKMGGLEQRYAQSKQHGAGTQTEGKQQADRTETREEHHKEKHQTPSLEQVTQYRQTAQQNSLDAVRAAEERYAKAKEEAANAACAAKESAKHGLGAAAARTRERVGATTQYLSEELAPVKETLSTAGQKTKEYTSEKAEDIKTGTQRAAEYASEKAVQAKDTTVSTTKSVAGYVGEKAAVAKDVAIEKAAVAKDVAIEKAAVGKDVAIEKAAVAKDVAIEKAAVAAGYAGKVAEGVKDQAVVAGWGVAHKTTEIAVEATKMAGGVVGKAKDVVASAAYKAAELAEFPVVMARDTAVDAGEKLADYTARKKMEAERYKEEKQLQYAQEGEHPTSGGGIGEKIQEATETVKDMGRGLMEGSDERVTGEAMMSESDPGVLGAIGETIVEIAQQTSQLVSGPGMQAQVKEKDVRKST